MGKAMKAAAPAPAMKAMKAMNKKKAMKAMKAAAPAPAMKAMKAMKKKKAMKAMKAMAGHEGHEEEECYEGDEGHEEVGNHAGQGAPLVRIHDMHPKASARC